MNPSRKRVLIMAIVLSTIVFTSCSSGLKIEHVNNQETKVFADGAKRYLLLPVEDRAPDALVIERTPGGETRRCYIQLAVRKTDYFVPMTLDGPTVFEITAPYNAVCWNAMRLADRFIPAEESDFRPIYHHTPPYGWMNDPNGLVWHEGEYHLFYQHNPYGSRWQNMTWGHSTSRDLLNWEHHPEAIRPDTLGSIFSGSSVIDRDNSAGFGPDALIALYTASGKKQTQCLAYSTDRGRTFTKYAGNPVLTKDIPDFRDPKVFRHEGTQKWILVLAAGCNMEFYSSDDLRTWHYESAFGKGYGIHSGAWECPDLIELPVDGKPENRRWVLICSVNASRGSVVQYFTGDFDGHRFTCDSDPATVKLMDYGQDHYAAVSWNGLPDGRQMAVAWMSNWLYANDIPTMTFRNANSVPRELKLFSKNEEIYLASEPCRELYTLRKTTRMIEPFEVTSKYNMASLLTDNSGAYELEMKLSDGTAEVYGFKLFNTVGEYVDLCINRIEETITLNRMNSGKTDFSREFPKTYPAPLAASDRYKLRVLIDRSSVECFVNEGELVMTNLIFPTEPYNRISFYSKGGKMRVTDFYIYKLEQ